MDDVENDEGLARYRKRPGLQVEIGSGEHVTTGTQRITTAGARNSLRAAIDAMCRSCIYDPLSGLGGWREQVAACACVHCPPHAVRPLPRSRDTEKASVTASKTSKEATNGR